MELDPRAGAVVQAYERFLDTGKYQNVTLNQVF
jgi:hypothetical protein